MPRFAEAARGVRYAHKDNTAATRLSKLYDINLSYSLEQDKRLKSLNPVEPTQKSHHTPLYTAGLCSESEDSMQTFCSNSELMPYHCHLQCGPGNYLPTEQEVRSTKFFMGSWPRHSSDRSRWSTFSECVIVIVIHPLGAARA